MLKGVKFTDRIEVPTERQITDSGQMIVPCAFARTGAQNYTAGSLGLQDVAADKIVAVMRDEADVFAEDTMSSFRSVPVTIGHPKDENGLAVKVTADNSAELQVGVLEGMPTRDEDTVTGTLVIARQDAIDLIEDGVKELSAGYTCDLEMTTDEAGELVIHQRNIRANHIAIVDKGRAGSHCSIADEAIEADSVDAAVEDEAEVEAVVEDAKETDEKVETEVEAEVADEQVSIEDELETAKTSVATLTDELATATAKIVTLQDEIEAGIETRVETILVAKDLTDLEDFSGKTVEEIKHMVVADQMPNLDLDGKSEAYVCARFDVLSEDAEIGETPMGKLLAKNVDASHVEVKPSTVVADARARATERFKTKS